MKREALRHPKMLDLSDRLNCSRPEAIGYLMLLLDWATEAALAGNVGKWTDGTIARACDWTADPSQFVDALVCSGWLDRCEKNRLIIHDWADHCERWVKLKADKLGIKLIEKPVVRSTEASIERTTEMTGEPPTGASPSRDLTYPNLTEPNTPLPPDLSNDGLDWSREQARFIARWNSTTGTLAFNRAALSDRHRRLLAQIAPSEIEQALAKFPLRCGFKPTLGKFFEDGVIGDIIDGKYDWEKTNGKPIGDPAASLAGRNRAPRTADHAP